MSMRSRNAAVVASKQSPSSRKPNRKFRFDLELASYVATPATTPTSGVFTSSGLLWDQDAYEWPSADGKRLPFQRVIAGLELDSNRIKSMRDPQLQLDLLGVPIDPFKSYSRNDYNRQLQRMYIQLMRPDRFRHYVGTANVFSGWQYPLGRENNIVDELLNVAPNPSARPVMYGPTPLDPGGDHDWADRIGYRVPIVKNTETSTFSFGEDDLKLRFENVLEKSQASTASRLLKDEEDWRLNLGVQYVYEVEVRIHPILNQPPQKGERFPTPNELGELDSSIYTPGDDWLNRPSLTVEFQGGEKTINQFAALETVYSVLAGRVGCGVPVVSMGPHLIDGDWKLVSIRVLPETNLWDVLMQTQTFINENSPFADTSEVNRIRQESAENLMMARLASFQLCVSKMAQVGFLHLGISAINLFQGTVWKSGVGGEGSFPAEGQFFKGAGATHVRDFRPSNVSIVRLPVDACESIMLTILVLDLYARDLKRELGFLDTLAFLLVRLLANVIASRTSNPQFEHLYRIMMMAWEFFYEDAKELTPTPTPTSVAPILAPASSINSSKKTQPPPAIRPLRIATSPAPLKSDLRRTTGPRIPLHLQQQQNDAPTPSPSSSSQEPANPYASKTLNTRENPFMFNDLFAQRESIPLSGVAIGRRVVDGSLDDSNSASTPSASTPIGSYAGDAFDFDSNRLESYIASKNNGWRPPKDTLVLALRLTHRLYELVRSVAYEHSAEQAKRGVKGLDPDLLKSSEDLVPPFAVRRFCDDPNPTESALELAASCLKRYAREG